MTSSAKEEFKQLPRAFKQLQFHASIKSLRTATALKELPSVLIPSNDRRIPLPPLVHYGYAMPFERIHELLAQKLGDVPGIHKDNLFGALVYLRQEFHYRIHFQAVYLDGTDSMFFLALGSNWEPALANRLEAVLNKVKDFLDVDEEPVWCLDTDHCFWRR